MRRPRRDTADVLACALAAFATVLALGGCALAVFHATRYAIGVFGG